MYFHLDHSLPPASGVAWVWECFSRLQSDAKNGPIVLTGPLSPEVFSNIGKGCKLKKIMLSMSRLCRDYAHKDYEGMIVRT